MTKGPLPLPLKGMPPRSLLAEEEDRYLDAIFLFFLANSRDRAFNTCNDNPTGQIHILCQYSYESTSASERSGGRLVAVIPHSHSLQERTSDKDREASRLRTPSELT